jgi:predicted nucleic acid-binding protein
MERIVLDTSVLLRYWRQRQARSSSPLTASAVRRWARALIDQYHTDAIVTPVYIEVVAGVRNKQELQLTLAYLGSFQGIDHGHILPEDWKNAIRLAQRVPGKGQPRDLGDCLIRAISDRLRHIVKTHDRDFPP